MPVSVDAGMFGDTPNELADLVITGVKTATCLGFIFYELKNVPMPEMNDYFIVLNSEEYPVAEGDGSYENWKSIHKVFYTGELQKVGLEFSQDMILVCKRFILIDIKEK